MQFTVNLHGFLRVSEREKKGHATAPPFFGPRFGSPGFSRLALEARNFPALISLPVPFWQGPFSPLAWRRLFPPWEQLLF